MNKIFTVSDTFNIKGRGLIVVGDWNARTPIFRLGDEVEIICPDRSRIFSTIKEFDCRINRENGKKFLSLGFQKLVQQSDIPIGSEIFVKSN